MNGRATDRTLDEQPTQRGNTVAGVEVTRRNVFPCHRVKTCQTDPGISNKRGNCFTCSGTRCDLDGDLKLVLINKSFGLCRQPQVSRSITQKCLAEGDGTQSIDSPAANTGTVTMLFGSPLPHMPRSPHDSSAAHLGLSPHQNGTHSGVFSPGALQSLFQSPSGATLDDSPFHSLSRPPAKHSPVSAAAQYSATQASRQASVGQAQAQRTEQQHSTACAADTKEQTSAGMLVPVNAPAALMADKQAPFGMGDSTFVERMPSFTSLVCGPPPKRQRCLKFDPMPDQDHSFQEYSTQSASPSGSQQESHGNAGLLSESQLQTSSVTMSEQVDSPNDSDSIKNASKNQERSCHQQSASVRSSIRHSSAALPALAAAMGSQAPNAASSAASAAAAAAAAAAVTPTTSRHMSSQSGEEASQSVLHPDTPGDAIAALSDRRLSTSSTRYRRAQHSSSSGPKRCNCKKSKCLKLYCDCFAAGVFCHNCSCSCCMNTEENKDLIMMTREQIIQRNPQAFDIKISKQRAAGADGTPGQHLRGCNCKKSHCRKKYCECFQAGVPCGAQCKCCDCHNCTPEGKGGPFHPPSSHSTEQLTAAQQAARGQGPAKTSPGTPAVRATSLGPDEGALHRPAPRQAPPAQSRREDTRPSAARITRKRDPRGKRGQHHQGHEATDAHTSRQGMQDDGEPGWGSLSRSMSEGAPATQAWVRKSPNTQVLADAPVMDTVLPISPLDARQGRLKQEDCQELHISHSADDVDYQGLEERYMYQRRDSGPPALSGSYSQLLTGHNSNSMVLVPCKGQPDHQPEALEVAMHRGSVGYDGMEQPQRTSTGSAAPEPYQILMPVQMADGQMTALPPDQAQLVPGTLFVPRCSAASHLDTTAMQFEQHSMYLEQNMAPPPGPGHHPYMSNDSILLQHYAEMAPMGEARSALQGDSHMHASTSFGTDQGPGGNQMMLSPDEEDLEQLIKGGPFELGLYADKLGSHMFGIDSVAQTGTGFSPPPLPWQTTSHLPQQQFMNSPVLQPLHQPHHQQQQHLGHEEPIHSSFQIQRAARPPSGGSPRNYGSPAQDTGVRKPTLTKRSGVTPVNLNRHSMSADLERAEAYDACDAYPASPSEQQAWTHMNKLPPQGSSGFLRLNSGIKTVFSPNQ